MYTYLKFGLPRVFPPNAGSQRSHRPGTGPGRGRVNRGYRDSSGPGPGSSGYDSSDNETTRGHRMPSNMRKFRSESDFRAIGAVTSSRPNSRAQHNGMGGGGGGGGNVGGGNIPLAALRQANSRASIAVTHPNHYMPNGGGKHYGNRSHSEADLLGGDMGMGYDYDSRINVGSRMKSEQYMMSRRQSQIGLIYPNIQVHCLDINSGLRGISLQAKAGDLFAIMATSQREGTALTETLAGVRDRMSGEILINGQHISQRGLKELCGYVAAPDRNSLDPRMSVQSTLSFHAALCGPMDKSDLKERVDILIEDLGLTAVRTANVSRLTHSEKQRLSVACQLLTQSAILILDQATTNMDIFDTFFLVEYLRQWSNGGRIVIMTLQPPTFEILSMCSGVLLLSGGRTVFSGSRSELPRHMSSLGYPCPPFKNPADYYLDLVTLDDLSAAAMLESSARIDTLASAWDQVNSEPPIAAPPASLPNFMSRGGFFEQMFVLAKRFIVYKQPGSLLSWITKLIAAAVLSLLIGCIFWDVPSSDPQLNLNDRLGYHHAIMAVAFWPIMLLNIRDIHEDRKHAERDIALGLYGRFIYILVQSLLNLFPSLCIWLAYLLPAHSMAGLYSYTTSSDTGIYLYMGYMLLYLMAIQSIALFTSHLMPTKTSSAVLIAIISVLIFSVGGYTVHPGDVPNYWSWMGFLSPQKWLMPVLTADEFSAETIANTAALFQCRNKQVQHQEIIVQQPCPVPNGTHVLADFRLLPKDHLFDPLNYERATVLGLVVAAVALFILACLAFVANCRRMFKAKTRK